MFSNVARSVSAELRMMDYYENKGTLTFFLDGSEFDK